MAKSKFWVGIGASAGGLEALKELVQRLKDEDAVYIIAQHLDPKHPTILKDLLERSTQLPINLVERDTEPEEGNIYIISPGHNAILQDEKIVLTPAAPVGPKPSINEFFTSLGQFAGEHAIGIILSGTGSDGAQGIIAIKAAGGIAFSQDEMSAKYSGMPRSAIETGMIDFILSPREIANELKLFIESSHTNNSKFSGPKVRSNLEKIFQRLYDQTNYDFSGYKIKTIQRRIQRRMVVNKVVTIDDYLTLLMSSTNEVENLFKELLISVTSFFRDPDAFEDLGVVIEKLITNSKPNETLRVWVPGCARGEEAYSIAILFQETIIRLNKDTNYQIFATDIDDYALNKARQGIYTEEQVKDIKPVLLTRYFNQYEDVYILKKDLRDQIVFAKQNIIMDPPFSHLDLISCRNVLIYFNVETQKKVFQTFHFALKPKGFLFLGKSESATSSTPDLFEIEKNLSQIFSRRMIDVNRRADQVSSAKIVSSNQISSPHTSKLKIKEISLQDQMEKTLINTAIPAAVVINSQGLMLHVRGDLNRFLTIPQGRIDNNILTMARENLKIDIRSLLQRAKRDENASAQALFFNHEADNHVLYLTISKIQEGDNDDLYVLAFFDLDIREGALPGVIGKDLRDMSNERLRQEVNIFRERLQSSIEDLETTNEELQSTNEELQSANEELQSANEELQTANEELQSTNEELSTVNEELEIKTHELSQVNNDLESMLWNIDELILFIDNRMRLKRYTDKAAKEFNLTREELGQVITSFELAQEITNLRIELLNVIEKESERTIELRKDNMHFDLRLVAYKADEKEVVGVMMFFEKTVHNSDQHQKNLSAMLGLLEINCNHPFICLGGDNKISYISQVVSELLGYSQEEMLHSNMNRIMAQNYNSFDEFLSDKTYADQKGWSSLALVKKSRERFVIKYRISHFPDTDISERIIFFDIDRLEQI